MRVRFSALAVLLVSALLASCAGAPAAGARLTSTATPPPTPTAAVALPTATATPATTAVTFTCPVTASHSTNVFYDSQTGLQFNFPSTWTEKACQRVIAYNSDGSVAGQSLAIGNLFHIAVSPRQGMTIQQFVTSVEGTDETVTLTPITVSHAVEADSLAVTAAPGAALPIRFLQTIAIIAGTQNFYEVISLIAQTDFTDTMPDQPIANVIATFDVP